MNNDNDKLSKLEAKIKYYEDGLRHIIEHSYDGLGVSVFAEELLDHANSLGASSESNSLLRAWTKPRDQKVLDARRKLFDYIDSLNCNKC